VHNKPFCLTFYGLNDFQNYLPATNIAFCCSGALSTLVSVEAMLPEKEFISTHRSYIVSTRHIKSFTSELIEIDDTEIPIGKLFRNVVLKTLG